MLTSLHIVLSTLVLGVLSIAAAQALLLAIQESLLRHKQTSRFLSYLPAMQVMELILFRIIVIGFLLLTLVLITSLFSFPDLFATLFWQKTFLPLLAWLVFMVLLLGRYYFGWRGRPAIRWTLVGVCIVACIYIRELLSANFE